MEERRKLRGGIVGLGRMGITHYAILNGHPDAEVVAACEPTAFVQKVFQRFSKIALHDGHEGLLGGQPLDFVIVCTPTASHAEIVGAALEKGVHVFTEKPLALTAEDGARLAASAGGRRLVNQVGYFLRFNPVLAEVKKLLAAGALGEIIHYKNEMYGRAVLRTVKSGWRAEKKMGGGCMLDFASHCLDLSDYFFGPVARASGSVLKKVYSTDVEDTVYTTLTHGAGVTGTVLVTWSDESYRRPYNRVEILGTQGRIIADRQEFRVYRREASAELGLPKGWTVRYHTEFEHGLRYDLRGAEFTLQLDHFVDRVRSPGASTACTFADAQRTDRVIDMIRQDAAGGGR